MQRKGESLANLLESAISERDEPRAEVVEQLASEAGIDPSTVNSILTGNIQCPPRERLAGFARVSGMPSLSQITSAAEEDGCDVQRRANPYFLLVDMKNTMARAREAIERWQRR